MINFNEQIVDDFRSYMLLEKGRSDHTVDGYVRDILQFERFILLKDFREVDSKDVPLFIRHLSKDEGLQHRTTNRKLSALKTFYSWLRKEKHIEVNPTEGMQGAKAKQGLPQPVDLEDIDLLFAAIPEEDLRAKVMIEILYGTGARRFEVAKIKIRDFNFNKKTIRLLGKGNKERIVPINDYALTLVKQLMNQLGKEAIYLFPSRQYPNRSISTRRINEIVTFYVNKAGLEGKNITPHKFRHSFGTHLHEGGVDLKYIQAMMGHEKADTTNIYTKVSSKQTSTVYQNAHPRALRI